MIVLIGCKPDIIFSSKTKNIDCTINGYLESAHSFYPLFLQTY
jgi:hypothetical protein